MKSPTVLHEILAVESGLSATASTVTAGTIKNLSGRTIFEGMTKKYEIFKDDEVSQRTVKATEYKEVQSTVDEQLDYLKTAISDYYDVSLQKESANQNAKADIIIDKKVIVKDVPAITLLGLEKKLTALLPVYNAITTLDSAIAWEVDEGNAKPGVFRTKHPVERQTTITTKEIITASPATQYHPAQIMQQDKVETVGKSIQTNFSSAISSHDKAARIQRLMVLIRVVTAARQRANTVEVDTTLSMGASLLDYINGK